MAEDFVIALPVGSDQLSPKFANVFHILGQLDKAYRDKIGKINSGEIFHLYMMGVYPQFKGQSIGRNLLLFAETIAKAQGYKRLVGEVTAPISQNILKSLNYTTEEKINYKDYFMNGI